MKTTSKIAALALATATLVSVLLFLPGCTRIARAFYLSGYDRDISSAFRPPIVLAPAFRGYCKLFHSVAGAHIGVCFVRRFCR